MHTALRLSAASVLLLALVAAGCASQSGTTSENTGATAMTSSTGAAASGGTSAAASGGTKPAGSSTAKPAATSTTAATPAATTASAGDGKAVWDQLNCKMCHAVSAKGIAGGKKAADLSGVGGKRSAEWLRSWFKKETQLNGKTHPKAIKTDAEVDALVALVRTF